jgi:sentrin-specific protease 1
MHWTLAVVNFRDKRVEYYDSMGGGNAALLSFLLRWVVDEMQHKKGQVLDESEWETVAHGRNVPQQRNSDDCGVFMCKFADFLARGAEINFTAAHMNYFRARMAHELMMKRLA